MKDLKSAAENTKRAHGKKAMLGEKRDANDLHQPGIAITLLFSCSESPTLLKPQQEAVAE